MNKTRSVSLAFGLQVLALIAISQPWFIVSMVVEGSSASLGSFDGAKTFAIVGPLALLSIAALAVTTISAHKTRFLAVVLTALASLAALIDAVPRVLAKDISGLDGQLDRLTGIANTHGLDTLAISVSVWPYLWALFTFASLLVAAWMLRLSTTWTNEDRSAAASKLKPRAKAAASTSSIDLWDDQRQ